MGEGDVKGAMRVLCSNDSFIAPDEPRLAAMQLLHRLRPADWRSPLITSTVAPMLATQAAVQAAILSFQGGSFGDPDGMRTQHLKDMLLGFWGLAVGVGRMGNFEAGEESSISSPFLQAVTDFMNLLLGGGDGLHTDVQRFLYGASLTALTKAGGRLRPIAVGVVW